MTKRWQKKIFDPVGMKTTTFDMARALKGNHASPHGDDIDGKPEVANIAFDYAVMPHRPAGGVWTSAHDLIRYVQLELSQGKLPSGKQLVSAEKLLVRRHPQEPNGGDATYGIGVIVFSAWGVQVGHYRGGLCGY